MNYSFLYSSIEIRDDNEIVTAWGSATPIQSASSISVASTKPPTTGLNFNPPSNLTASLSATDSNSSFQLQKPPTGNKRGKH